MPSGHHQKEGIPDRRPDVAAEAWRTPAQWAEAIRSRGLNKAAEGTIETGMWLLAAKDALGHGRFLNMLRDHLKISADRAEQYMGIARGPVIQDSADWRNLPAARAALAAFVRLPERVQMEAIIEGRVHPGMTVKDVRRLGAAAGGEEQAWDIAQARDALRRARDHAVDGCPIKGAVQLLEDHAEAVASLLAAYRMALAPGPDEIAALYQMREELAAAEPGNRHLVFDEVGKLTDTLRQPSTYPGWMGKRTRGEADRKIDAIDKLLDGRGAGGLVVGLLAEARRRAAP